MALTDLSFIFFYMPGFFLLYWIVPAKARRWLLAAGGLAFYAWGNLRDAAILLALCLLVWLCSLGISRSRGWAAVGIAFCVAALAVFKYVHSPLGFPLGASFYIFHMISYLADVAGGEPAEKNPIQVLAYLAMFPKLLMGPIVRYRDLAAQIRAPQPDVNGAANGLFRFVVGLSKKALIAMQLAPITESLWKDAPFSAASAWLGAVCFSLQLYFDFSSYSDMAIGLGRMAGLEFGENFLHPYTSCSVSEFYRRWHASLGRWFRDYVYIPLGGSRRGTARTLLNLMVVWLLTGIWHGSTLNFLVWGAGLGVLICLEKLTGISKARPTFWGWLWTTVIIVISWVIFHAADLGAAAEYIRMMFGGAPLAFTNPLSTALHDTWYVIAAAVFGCTPAVRNVCLRLFADENGKTAMIVKTAVFAGLLAFSLLALVNSGYSAFIYAQF